MARNRRMLEALEEIENEADAMAADDMLPEDQRPQRGLTITISDPSSPDYMKHGVASDKDPILETDDDYKRSRLEAGRGR